MDLKPELLDFFSLALETLDNPERQKMGQCVPKDVIMSVCQYWTEYSDQTSRFVHFEYFDSS
jgi:hypothetical protein